MFKKLLQVELGTLFWMIGHCKNNRAAVKNTVAVLEKFVKK